MGFYGNITNTSKTQFQFDKTFPNRASMDQFIGTDGVYIGRYVLVEYDKALAADWSVVAYKQTVDGVIRFYSSVNAEADTEIKYGNVNIEKGKYLRVPGSFYDVNENWVVHNLDNPEFTHDLIYLIEEQQSEDYISVSLVAEKEETENDYIVNYNTDRRIYGGGRGYDSTVWQKVYADGIERYVMIAELNSVVPTFGISADAPTISPVAPHFDVDSTNIYYKVHWQPNWGLRVRAAAPMVKVKPTNAYGDTVLGNEIELTDKLDYAIPSDETTVWKRAVYDTRSGELNKYYFSNWTNTDTDIVHGEWIKSEEAPETAGFPAAIYYNKDGFNPAVISYSDSNIKDKISIEPTGLSGTYYNNHNGNESSVQIDTQEISILLPSLGNSVAKMWDLVYGDMEVNKSNNRNMIIDWTEGSIIPNLSGLRLITKSTIGYGFDRKNASTLAGAINSVHDLMGMIIREVPDIEPGEKSWGLVDTFNDNYIYYLNKVGQYARKQKQYEYSPLNSGEEDFYFDKNNRFIGNIVFDTEWTLPHSKFYLDYPNTAPVEDNTKYPNLILESNVYHDDNRQYYSSAYLEEGEGLGPYTTENFGGSFEIYKFFELGEREIAYNQQLYKTSAYQISLDTEYNNSKNYYAVSHEFLGDNTRFWVEGEYLVGEFVDYPNHTYSDFEDRILFELIQIDGKNKYTRPEVYDPAGSYYTATFVSDEGIYDDSKQYFIVSRKVENNKTYIEKIDYIAVPMEEINEINFYYRNYYTTTDKFVYTIATQYTPGTQYYSKKITLQLVESNTSVSAGDVNEVDVIPYKANMGYCKYYPRGAGGANGLDEYVELTETLIPMFPVLTNLVKISVIPIVNIYQPNLYYYEITEEGNPLKGSIVFDANALPTEGRKYYTRYALKYGEPVVKLFYEPYKYYYYNEDLEEYVLETSERPIEGREYLKKSGLYVLEDVNGCFVKGSEWNLNVNPVPAGIVVGDRQEHWGLEELYGFGRHYTTIHGLILRLTNILESKNTEVRDYNSIQGVLNRIRDLFVNFGETRANEIMVSDKYGRLISTGFVDDDWISATYNDEENDGKISINHQYIGQDSGIGEHYTHGEAADRVLNYGDTFISPSFGFTTDDMGHVNSFETSFKTLTMPTLEFIPDTSGNVMTDLTMSAGSGQNVVTFTEYRQNVGTLSLAEYVKNTADEDLTKISDSDSINTAFAKINSTFNSLDYDIDAQKNYYVSKVKETNGIIDVSLETTTNITALGTITEGCWDSEIGVDRVLEKNIIKDAVVEDKIKDGSVTTYKIASGNVTTDRIADSAIVTSKIAARNITTDKIAEGAITSYEIGLLEVKTPNINDLAVTTEKINASAVTTDKIANYNITNEKLAPNGLDISKFTTGILSMDRIAAGAIDTSKMADSVITEIKINSYAVTNNKIADNAVTTSKISDNNITTSKIADSAITINKIADNAIGTNQIIDESITSEKIASLEASKITGTLDVNNIPNLEFSKINNSLEGARVILSNYSSPDETVDLNILSTDNVILAISKLEKRISDLEKRISDLEENHDTAIV